MVNEKFYVNEYVAVTGNNNPIRHHYQIGEVIKITSISGNLLYCINKNKAGIKQYLKENQIKKVTTMTQDELAKLYQPQQAGLAQQQGGIINIGTVPPPSQQAYGTISGFATLVNNGQPFIQEQPKPSKLKIVKTVIKKKVSFDSVVISNEKREEIKAAISQVDNTNLIFDTWGFSDVFEKGTAITLLFYGIPGGGKTLMAQAIAEELDAELKIYGMAEIGSSEPGGSERFIQKIFKEAKEFFNIKKQHRVILFDECDALLYDRNKVGVILGAQINTLLTEIERHDGIIIFTTNRIGTLDPALERRIAAKIEFPFPTKEQRVAIWKRMIPKSAPLDKDVDFEKLGVYPLAGGNIKNAVLNAARMAAYKKQKKITMDNFVVAIEREAASQKAFEAEFDKRNKFATSPLSAVGGDYGMSENQTLTVDRQIKADSVFNRNKGGNQA